MLAAIEEEIIDNYLYKLTEAAGGTHLGVSPIPLVSADYHLFRSITIGNAKILCFDMFACVLYDSFKGTPRVPQNGPAAAELTRKMDMPYYVLRDGAKVMGVYNRPQFAHEIANMIEKK